ncbi:hypothetical protein JZ751_001543, partial [Albula glossodonta]
MTRMLPQQNTAGLALLGVESVKSETEVNKKRKECEALEEEVKKKSQTCQTLKLMIEFPDGANLAVEVFYFNIKQRRPSIISAVHTEPPQKDRLTTRSACSSGLSEAANPELPCCTSAQPALPIVASLTASEMLYTWGELSGGT